ncbi:MAG: hypothetical protein HY736_13875 [Verrucomicrobia bacterium]|nr:hypothetical protein [Verrucomicrobiota bacterium]
MILCAVIGVSIVSYLGLGRTTMEISNRALYNNGAMNLAENGLEQAVYAVNKAVADPSYNWSSHGWTTSGDEARQRWTGYSFGQGATGEVRAYVEEYTGGVAPKIVSRSIVTLGGSSAGTLEKWIEVRLRKTSRFANGLVARDSISFSGTNASVDSWNSDPDRDPATAAIPYSAAVRNDNGTVGSISVSVNAVAVNNADIWGYASTGGALPSVGSNGTVGPFGTATGTMDMSHVSTDFSASFDAVTFPTATYSNYGGAITTTISLPRGGIDTMAADGYYYIEADSVNFTNETLTITAKVILKLTNALTAIDIGGGSGALNINTGAELQVYGAGDIKIAGQGLLNGGTTAATANQPAKCQFYGTKTSGTQDIQIAGNGVLSALVYAPQGSVKINGNGDVCGSVVANSITCTGNAAFHYDESLANFGGNNPYRVSRWTELTTAADRARFSSKLSW